MARVDSKVHLSFDDVSILDNLSMNESRADVSLSLSEHNLWLPLATASMDSVISSEMASEMMKFGACVIHHRYESVEERSKKLLKEYVKSNTSGLNGVAIGLLETEAELFDLWDSGAELFSIDVAAAHNIYVLDRIAQIKKLNETTYLDFPVKVVVGSVSSEHFVQTLIEYDLLDAVDFIRVSQGGGSVCTTRINTGIGKPTFQAILDLHDLLMGLKSAGEKVPEIMCDGGVRCGGDIVKAYGAGASVVMLGALLAGHDECPLKESMVVDGKEYRPYRGMASAAAKSAANMVVKNIEGVSKWVPYKGPVKNTLEHLTQCIQSGVGTAGFSSLREFIGNADFIRVSYASHFEAQPHVISSHRKYGDY